MEKLVSVTIPESVTSIGSSAFENCRNLITMRYDGMLSTWCQIDFATATSNPMGNADRVFINRQQVQGTLNLPDGLKDVKKYAFYSCRDLTSVTIPESIVSIGNSAFQDCSNLTSVVIGKGVASIGEKAFSNCRAMECIYCYAPVPPTLWGNPFEGVPQSVKLYVPCVAEFDYQTTDYWAVFSNMIGVEHQVQVTVDDISMGTAILKQPVLCETSEAVVEAVANEGYCFARWSDGNTENPRTVTVTSDTILFAPVCHVYAEADNRYMGSVTGGGEYACGATITIEAVPNEGYSFAQWSDGNTDNPRTVTITSDTVFTSLFTPVYQLYVDTYSSYMGSVTGGGEYVYGATATIEATPNEGCYFVQWSDGSTDNPRYVEVTGDMYFTAYFEYIMYYVNVSANDPTMGSVRGGKQYKYGATATIEAIPAEGYRFVQWSDGNTDNPRTLTVIGDISLTAEFVPIVYQVTADVTDPAMGNVTGGGEYAYGTSATLEAIPSAGYRFVQWSDATRIPPAR